LYPLLVAAIAAAAFAVVPTARADDRGAALAIVDGQLRLLDDLRPLNRCLAASPRKNTPCIVRAARRVAAGATRHISAIRAALDGDEVACVRSVAAQEISIQTLWRRGALALTRNERKRARSLFVAADKLGQAQARVQPRCFADVLTRPPG